MSLKGSFNASFALDNLCAGHFFALLCNFIELFFILGWGNMLATHESQSLSRKDSIPALLCHSLFCTASSLPRSLHLGLFCEIVLSSTPLPHHPLTSSSKHAMSPNRKSIENLQLSSCWKNGLIQPSETRQLSRGAMVSFVLSIESWNSYGWCRFESRCVPILKKL